MNIIEKTYKLNGTLSIRNKTEKIILHHADSSSCTVEDIDRWHKNNGWTCIGYHFFVKKDGSIYRGRQEDSVGAHAKGSNSNSIGICFEGRYGMEKMPDIQVSSGAELVSYLKQKYNITKVEKHSDKNNTSCPGENFRFDEIANSQGENIILGNKEENYNDRIKLIQETLNSRYRLNIAVDNIYGAETKKALIKALQTELNKQFDKGLIVDGIFGPKTKNACVTLKKGDKGNITWIIQSALICNGYNLELDGIFGDNTEKTVKDYQTKMTIDIDGMVGENTFSKLFE